MGLASSHGLGLALGRPDQRVLVLDQEKAKAWLVKGAQPTDRVARLLSAHGIMPAPACWNTR